MPRTPLQTPLPPPPPPPSVPQDLKAALLEHGKTFVDCKRYDALLQVGAPPLGLPPVLASAVLCALLLCVRWGGGGGHLRGWGTARGDRLHVSQSFLHGPYFGDASAHAYARPHTPRLPASLPACLQYLPFALHAVDHMPQWDADAHNKVKGAKG